MDLLENIEKKDTIEPPEEKDEEDIEVDTDVDDEEKDSEEDSDEDSESSSNSLFKSYATSIGHGLYIVSPWMYKSSVENNWEQVLGNNNSVMTEIERLANKTDSDISQLSDVSDREITRDRMLVCAIYNEKTDKVFVLKSSFKMNSKAEYYPSMNELKDEGIVKDNQEKVLGHILSVAKKWASSIPEYYTAREDATALSDNPGKHKSWNKYESELMSIIDQKNVKDDLGPAQVLTTSNWSQEERDAYFKSGRDLIAKLLAQQDQDSDPRGKR
jgi:hypothetical protein